MKFYNDDVLFWRQYESSKDRVFINFSKNEEMRKRFIKLITEMKLKTIIED